MAEPGNRAARRAATARRILAAAQVEFGERGFDGATIRAIARRAGVDPSLVIQHYGSKAELFAVATQLRHDDPNEDAVDHLMTVAGLRLSGLEPETRAMVRSMLTAPEATRAMRTYLEERIANLAAQLDGEQPELRAALVTSSLLGVTVARHFLGVEALGDISEEEMERVVRPWIAAAVAEPGDG